MFDRKSAVLKLEDGTTFAGFSFGAEISAEGEVVFNTAMVGYPELLSDPLTRGQVVVLTYPLIGNYGVPAVDELETPFVQAGGLVVTDYSEVYSHFAAQKSLGDWLKENNVPAIFGVDTREVAKHLREHGEMKGRIIIGGNSETCAAPQRQDRAETTFGEGDLTICHIGEGLKNSIVKSFQRRGARITTDTAAPCDGYLVTGTCGEASAELIDDVRQAVGSGRPVLGVCGGDLPIVQAVGGAIGKLAHSHRGTNQPVIEVGTSHAMITTQNHGWAVVRESLPEGWSVWFENLNDGSVEGVRCKEGFVRGVSFHPEASMRPAEADRLYDEFMEAVGRQRG